LISDSCRESILKSVFPREGLSGMIFFEQEMKKKAGISITNQDVYRLDIGFQSNRIGLKNEK
jgi:fructose-bisphosphate aldolase class 1